MDVCKTLQAAGFKGLLVGGCVRDLLLGLKPKDFDVATDGHPGEVKQLFKRSRIVGRRFQIVHVRYGREIVEVTTFRSHHDLPDEENSEEERTDSAVCEETGMLLRDNVFGNIEEDAARRDFTVNSLFYDPIQQSLMDYTGGLEDLEKRILRVIGEPRTRFQEDPVRMLRAIRFSAKLGLTIEPEAESSFASCGNLLYQVSSARMFDEVLKLFMSGSAAKTYEILNANGLFEPLFPMTAELVAESESTHNFLLQALLNTDERIAADKPVTPAFLFAALLWPPVCERYEEHVRLKGSAPILALREAAQEIVFEQLTHTAIPRRFSTPMKEIWELQLRLLSRKRPQHLASNPRFRAAYDFILLREQNGEDLDGAGEWWTKYQETHEIKTLPAQDRPPGNNREEKRRRRPRRRRRNPNVANA